jgi:hypothetical protein
MSQGTPTRLVRDRGIEGDDPVEPGPFKAAPIRSENLSSGMSVAKGPKSLDFTFEVGEREKHSVRFYYNQFWGNARISVDGVIVKRFLALFSISTSRWYRFAVGGEERHNVEIQKERKWLFAFAREQNLQVFIDGVLSYRY